MEYRLVKCEYDYTEIKKDSKKDTKLSDNKQKDSKSC